MLLETYEYVGLRIDRAEYEIGDICEKSHQLLQDPEYDEDGNLVYPYISDIDSPYYGYYDAGELNGTCAIKVTNIQEIEKTYRLLKLYRGIHLYVLYGDIYDYGCDEDEIIINDTIVLEKIY